MKLIELKSIEKTVMLSEELVLEGIISSLTASVKSVKDYFSNISLAKDTAKELSSNDGKKGFDDSTVADAAKEIRAECVELYSRASPKVKKAIDTLIVKTKTTKLSGVYISRSFFKDFVSYYFIKSVLTLTKNSAYEVGLDLIIDKITGFILTALTGIPSVADMKDIADVTKTIVKSSNELATKVNSLKNSVN